MRDGLYNQHNIYHSPPNSMSSPAKRPPGSRSPSPPAKRQPPPLDIAAIRAQLAAKKAALQTPPQGPPLPPLPPKPPVHADVADRLAAAKARIEALNARAANPYLSGAPVPPVPPAAPAAQPSVTSIALHPLLMAADAQPTARTEKNEKRAMRDRYKTMAPKFTSVRANASVAAHTPAAVAVAAAPVLNPYAAGSATHSPAPDDERAPVRKSKKLQFSRAGKYVEQGDQLRNEQKMEALRQRIAEASRKAGLDSEFDTLERSLKVCRLTF